MADTGSADAAVASSNGLVYLYNKLIHTREDRITNQIELNLTTSEHASKKASKQTN